MPWESGPRGRPYYTRTRRENGRVIRESIGVGQEGQRAAEEDEARRPQVEADREAERPLAEEIRCGRRPGRRRRTSSWPSRHLGGRGVGLHDPDENAAEVGVGGDGGVNAEGERGAVGVVGVCDNAGVARGG